MINITKNPIIKIQKNFIGQDRNLFIINYPLQLLNAIEAQKYFKTKNNILIIFYYEGQENNYEQLMKLIELFDYTKLIIYQKKSMDFMISLIKEINKEVYTKVFTGFFSANSRRIIANLQYEQLFLIDDGVYTISIHNELYNKNLYGYKKNITEYSEHKYNLVKKIVFYLYHHYRKLYFTFLGYQNDMKDYDMSFFTIFKLPQYNNENIVKNKYSFLKNYYLINTKSDTSNIVYFLGQPLYNVLDLSYADYLNLLKNIFLQYQNSGKKIIYIPHRGESLKSRKEIKTLFKNIEMLELNIPFELYLLENTINISYLASFVSSALFTVKVLYPKVNIDAYVIPLKEKEKKTTLLIYDMLKKSQGNILYLDKKGNISKK